MSLEDFRERLAVRRPELLRMRIAVLAGGGSAEREVSLRSGAAVQQVLERGGYAAQLLTVDASNLRLHSTSREQLPAAGSAVALPQRAVQLLPALGAADIVLTMLHGGPGENGAWQGLLELANVPFVSAGVKGSAVAMDKIIFKRVLESMRIPTPPWWTWRAGAAWPVPQDIRELVAKPPAEGSSVGVLLLENSAAGQEAAARLAEQYGTVLLEQRIHGTELTCAVIGPAKQPLALPLVQITAAEEFYDYTAKYSSGGSNYECPAPIDSNRAAAIQQDAQRVYSELELEPFARLDCILDVDGQHWFLEANTLPGFTELSLLPMAAAAAGVEMRELLELLLLFALERHERHNRSAA